MREVMSSDRSWPQVVAGSSPFPATSRVDVGGAVGSPTDERESSDGRTRACFDPEAAAAVANWPTIPGYRILALLGRGGMGVVLLARHERLKRLVAIKTMIATTSDGPEALARFRSEAETVARLQHPNIVQIFEVGDWQPDGPASEPVPFLVLEHVDGGTLAGQARHRPQPPDQAADLVEQIARAVDYAHQHGVIHRDLKPSNILMTSDGQPKVMDFGLARLIGEETGLTRTGIAIGTPSYMAPEQAQGNGNQVGVGADVYGLGAILYELLTGRPPFLAATEFDTIYQVVANDPLPPRRLQPQVPIDLETICLKCLEKEPERRYASAAELADDLHRFRTGQPIRARRAGTVERMVKWSRRRPAVAGLIAGVFIVACLGFAGVSWQWARAETKADEAARALLIAEAQERRAVRAQLEAEAARDQAEASLYSHCIVLAQRELEHNNVPAALRLLDRWPTHAARDRRSWEWYYLKRQCASAQHTWQFDAGWGWHLDFSPDGSVVAVALGAATVPQLDPTRTPGKLALIDTASGQPNRTLEGHPGSIRKAQFSPDGQLLLSTSIDGSGRVWRVSDCETVHTFRCYRKPQPVWLPDSSGFIVVTPDKRVTLWRLKPGPPRAEKLDLWDPIGFLGGGSQMVTYAYVNKKRLLAIVDFPSCHVARTFEVPGRPLCISNSGAYAAFSSRGTIRVLDLGSGQYLPTIRNVGSVYTASFHPHEDVLATGGPDRAVHLWNVREGSLLRTFHGPTFAVQSVAFSNDGGRLAAADQDGVVHIWDLNGANDFTAWRTGMPVEFAGCPAFNADGDQVLLPHTAGPKLLRFDVQEKRNLPPIEVAMTTRLEYPRSDMVFSSDGRWFAAPGREDDSLVRIWDTGTGQIRTTLAGHSCRVHLVALSHDGEMAASYAMATAREVGGIRVHASELFVWNVASGAIVLALNPIPITALAISADGSYLAAIDYENALRLWAIRDGTAAQVPSGHDAYALAIDFSPNGRYLATGGFVDNQIHVWKVPELEEVVYERGIGGPRSLTCVRFSPDSRRLAAVGYDAEVTLWDVGTGNPLLTLRGSRRPRELDRGFTPGVSFSPDGRRIATLNAFGEVTIWDADPHGGK